MTKSKNTKKLLVRITLRNYDRCEIVKIFDKEFLNYGELTRCLDKYECSYIVSYELIKWKG